MFCTTIHRYPIFSTRYSVMYKVYTGYYDTSWIEHGLCACTVDNPLAKARGLSLHTGAQTMLYLSHVTCFLLYSLISAMYKEEKFRQDSQEPHNVSSSSEMAGLYRRAQLSCVMEVKFPSYSSLAVFEVTVLVHNRSQKKNNQID